MLGFLVWKVGGEEEKEWKPQFPEGTNVEFLDWYLGGIKKEVKGLGVENLYGMGSCLLSVFECVAFKWMTKKVT